MNLIHNPSFQWQNIDYVCVDMDGTLLDLHYDNQFWLEYVPEIYAQKNAMTLKQSKQKLYQLFEKEKGTLNWYCLDYWSELLQLDITTLKSHKAHLIKIREGVVSFLEYVQKLQKDLYLVTNAHQDAIQLKMKHVHISHYFDKIICSHDLGIAKESARFWDLFSQEFDIKKDKTLFIDDSEAVLQAAKGAGIKYVFGIRAPDSNQPEKELENFDQIQHFSDMINLT